MTRIPCRHCFKLSDLAPFVGRNSEESGGICERKTLFRMKKETDQDVGFKDTRMSPRETAHICRPFLQKNHRHKADRDGGKWMGRITFHLFLCLRVARRKGIGAWMEFPTIGTEMVKRERQYPARCV